MSQRRVLSLRFDLDTVTGIENGIEPLLKAARECGVRFSFFVNMGTSFSLRYLMHRLRRSRTAAKGEARPCKESLFERLGVRGLLKTVLQNPALGIRYSKEIARILDDGHELGLHGGRSHPAWQYSLGDMDAEAIHRSVTWGLEEFRNVYKTEPQGFTSPGFVSDARVDRILCDLGFVYSGDALCGPLRKSEHASLVVIPANLTGPGGVPLIEHLICAGHSRNDAMEMVWNGMCKLDFVSLYGHPVFEGRYPDIIKGLLQKALDSGWDVLTHREVAGAFCERASPTV